MTHQTSRGRLCRRNIVVEPGECQFLHGEEGRLVAFGLHADIALIASAPTIGWSALLRFTDPLFQAAFPQETNFWRFADTGISLLLAGLRDRGAEDHEIVFRAMGGSYLPSSEQLPNLGVQNILSMRRIFREEGVVLNAEDLGQNMLRSVWYEPAHDRLLVRTSAFRESASLGSAVATLAS